jgi:hypothetical protein
VATHGLVYMLVTSRWKQVVGYQFTGKSFDAGFLREDIENIIPKSESIGLQIDALRRLYNNHAGRDSVIQNSAPHPSDPSSKLYFNPYAPHI